MAMLGVKLKEKNCVCIRKQWIYDAAEDASGAIMPRVEPSEAVEYFDTLKTRLLERRSVRLNNWNDLNC
jgi:hypothetical protein